MLQTAFFPVQHRSFRDYTTINPTSILEESYHLQQRWNDSNRLVQLQLHFDLDEIDVQIR